MVKKRITRKELLKEPDEFMTLTGRVIQFARKYKNPILYGTAALMVAVLAVSGIRYYRGWKENQASAALRQATARYESSGAEKKDLPAVKQEFQKVVDKYSNYHGGKMARLLYANLLYESGEYDPAIENYRKALEDFSEYPSLKTLIRSSIGYAYQGKKDFQAAAEQFEAMVSDPDAYMKDEALFSLGILYAELGKPEKSREAFQKILSDYPDSSYTELVKERLAA
jgi:tetratricopeptide (TPR) repeat protein